MKLSLASYLRFMLVTQLLALALTKLQILGENTGTYYNLLALAVALLFAILLFTPLQQTLDEVPEDEE